MRKRIAMVFAFALVITCCFATALADTLTVHGVKGAGQGYFPFVADTLASGRFVLSDSQFSFPYRSLL